MASLVAGEVALELSAPAAVWVPFLAGAALAAIGIVAITFKIQAMP